MLGGKVCVGTYERVLKGSVSLSSLYCWGKCAPKGTVRDYLDVFAFAEVYEGKLGEVSGIG